MTTNKKATRKVFYATENGIGLLEVSFAYHSGFSISQKQISIANMHKELKAKYPNKEILEISKASPNELGVKLSAFNLQLDLSKKYNICASVERFFQGSKVFENGGPFHEIIYDNKIHPKRYEKLKNNGKFIKFILFNREYSTTPKTCFYDFLYINALKSNTNLAKEVLKYDYFTDIEFNHKRSISSQSKSVALFKFLCTFGLLKEATSSYEKFLEFHKSLKIDGELF